MKPSLKRIASSLVSRYGGLKDVEFSVEQAQQGDGFGAFAIRVDWTADEKLPVVHPHGLMWFAEDEDDAFEVLRWIELLRRGSAATEPRPPRRLQ